MLDVTKINARADKEHELIEARTERLGGLLEYTAMMADVELPDDEESEEDGDEL